MAIKIICDCCGKDHIGQYGPSRYLANFTAPNDKDFNAMNFDLCDLCLKSIVAFIGNRKKEAASLELK